MSCNKVFITFKVIIDYSCTHTKFEMQFQTIKHLPCSDLIVNLSRDQEELAILVFLVVFVVVYSQYLSF